jgi:excisionase family DNA binding protein
MERLTYTITEVAQLLGISRSKAYELVAEGLLPVVPLPGRRKLVARAVVARLVEAPGPSPDHETSSTSHRRTGSLTRPSRVAGPPPPPTRIPPSGPRYARRVATASAARSRESVDELA